MSNPPDRVTHYLRFSYFNQSYVSMRLVKMPNFSSRIHVVLDLNSIVDVVGFDQIYLHVAKPYISLMLVFLKADTFG